MIFFISCHHGDYDTGQFSGTEPNDSTSSEVSSSEPVGCPSAEQKRQIGIWVNEGMGLSDIQR